MPRFGGMGGAFGRMGGGGNVPISGAGAAIPPSNSVAPVISGNTQVGQTLTTTDGTWTGDPVISFTYQWKRGGVDIASATANTYVLVEADAGAAITCVVTGTNGAGNSTGTSNALTIDVFIVFTAHVEDPTDVAAGSSYSGGVWNGVAIGVAAANRKIVLGFVGRDSAGLSTFSAQTVGGNASTQVLRLTNTANIITFQILDLTTGTTANLITTIANATLSRLGVGIWAIYGAGSSTPTDTDSSTTDAGAVSLTVAAKGVAMGVSIGVGGTSCTVTGLTERYDVAIETTVLHCGADLNSNAGGNISMNFDWAAAPTSPLAVFASFA